VGRECAVELIVNKNAEERLKLFCSLFSKLWNEASYTRGRMFSKKGSVNLKAIGAFL
jgi:hypothetical protein